MWINVSIIIILVFCILEYTVVSTSFAAHQFLSLPDPTPQTTFCSLK